MKTSDAHVGRAESEPQLVDFYLGRVADARGRMVSDVWLKDYRWLEYTHDYIQWLFPLKSRSRYNPDAPILTEKTINIFRSSDELRERLLKSLAIMLKFYGLQTEQIADKTIRIVESEEFLERSSNWLSPGNHNFLRITRILASLRTLGLGTHAQALFGCLDQIYEEKKSVIGKETRSYWKSAAGN